MFKKQIQQSISKIYTKIYKDILCISIMNKKILIGSVVILVILIAGYFIFFNQSSEIESENSVTNSITNNQLNSITSKPLDSIDDVIKKLSNNFEMGEKEEAWYQMIGAYDGTKIDVDNTKIEIYQFKDSQGDVQDSIKESADTANNIIFDIDNFVILIHSKDNEFAEEIKQALN